MENIWLHREALEFGKKEYKELQSYANEIGIDLFATPFDLNSVDFLSDLNMPAYKIASADLNNTILQQEIAKQNKPILSTGGGSLDEVKEPAIIFVSLMQILQYYIASIISR